MADPEVRIKIKADGSEAKKTFADFAKEIPGVGTALNLLKNPLVALTGLFTALAAGIRSSIKEFAQAEVQSARLDAALARSGQLTDQYRESLHELAGQLQKTTGIADDQWFEVLRKLTQFGANEGNIGALADGVKNLAGIMDGDLTGAANLVGRALQGNFEVLGRYGIQAKDLTTLLQELAVKGQGQLEAQTKTLIGTWQNLKNQIADLFEGVGGLINRFVPLKATVDLLAGSFEWWVEAIGNVQARLPGLNNAVDGSVEAQTKLATAAREHAEALGELKTQLDGINTAYEKRRALETEQLDDEQRELAAEKDAALATLEASQLSAPEKAAAKFQIERSFNQRGRDIDNRRIAGGVFSARDEAQASASTLAKMRRNEAELAQKVAAGSVIDKREAELRNMEQEVSDFDASKQVGPSMKMIAPGVFAPIPAHVENRPDTPRIAQLRSYLSGAKRQTSTTAADAAALANARAAIPGFEAEASKDMGVCRSLEGRAVRGYDSRQRENTYRDLASATRAGAEMRSADSTLRSGPGAGAGDFVDISRRSLAVIEQQDAVIADLKRRLAQLEQTNRTDPGKLK